MANTFSLSKKLIVLFLTFIVFFSSIWILVSPFKRYAGGMKQIKNEIIIHAPVADVFHYLGNSSNAQFWSVFVKKIVTINADSIKDGLIGSRRRCYVRQQHLRDAYWDELITEVNPLKKRQLSIYNLHNFSLSAEGLITEQQYEKIDENTTRLVFSVFYKNDDVSTIDLVKTHLASFKIQDIFRENMNNIKNQIENNVKSAQHHDALSSN